MSGELDIYTVTKEETRAYAQQSIPFFFTLGTEFVNSNWSVDRLRGLNDGVFAFSDEVLDIYDISGLLVFRDYRASISAGGELRVRVAGNRVLGAAIVSIGVHDNPLDIDSRLDKARSIFEQNKVTGIESVVCHAYPRLGLLRSEASSKFLVDLMDFSFLNITPGAPGQDVVWSVLERIPENAILLQVDTWEREKNALLQGEWRNLDDLELTIASLKNSIARAELNVHLLPQTHPWSCVPATGSMILNYFGFCTSESALIVAMKTVSNVGNPAGLGTDLKNELKGYQDVTAAKKFIVSSAAPPRFDLVTGSIVADGKGFPVKIGAIIKGAKHARAVAGWQSGPQGNFIYLNDPLPLGHGDFYKEHWLQYLHTDLVFVRPPAAPQQLGEEVGLDRAAVSET